METLICGKARKFLVGLGIEKIKREGANRFSQTVKDVGELWRKSISIREEGDYRKVRKLNSRGSNPHLPWGR